MYTSAAIFTMQIVAMLCIFSLYIRRAMSSSTDTVPVILEPNHWAETLHNRQLRVPSQVGGACDASRTCQQHAGSFFQRNRNRRGDDWQAAERAGKPRNVAQHRLVSVALGRRPFNTRAGRSSPPFHCGTTRRENGRRGHVAAWFSRDHT